MSIKTDLLKAVAVFVLAIPMLVILLSLFSIINAALFYLCYYTLVEYAFPTFVATHQFTFFQFWVVLFVHNLFFSHHNVKS